MARPVTVYTITNLNGDELSDTLVFSTCDMALQDMTNEYLNQLDALKEEQVDVLERYIDGTSAYIRTEVDKYIWHLAETVVDGNMVEREGNGE